MLRTMFDKKEKQLIKLVHVIALSALHQANPTHKTETELKKYAFPLELDLEWFVNIVSIIVFMKRGANVAGEKHDL